MMDRCQLTDLSAQKTPEASSTAGNVPAREYPSVWDILCLGGQQERPWAGQSLELEVPEVFKAGF